MYDAPQNRLPGEWPVLHHAHGGWRCMTNSMCSRFVNKLHQIIGP